MIKTHNSTVIKAQKEFSKKEKTAWDKFEAVRDAEYPGPDARKAKRSAITVARVNLRRELAAAQREYAELVGAA